MKRSPDEIRRRQEIVAMYQEGSTYQEVGESFDLTRERVRQIVAEEGVFPRTIRETKLLQSQRYFRAVATPETLELIRSDFAAGATMEEIKRRFPQLTRSMIRRVIDGSFSPTERRISRRHRQASADQEIEIVANLRKAAEILGGPLSGPSYNRIAVRHGWVGRQIIAIRFGTWSAACEAAGVEYKRSFRLNYEKLTDDEVWSCVVEVTRDLGRVPTFDEYGSRARRDDLVSGSLVRNRFGSWKSVMSRLREEGWD